jgi:hypothetical protein
VSTDPAGQAGAPSAGQANAPGEPTEEELRAAYEAELSRITPAEMMLQAAVSLLNIGARRLGLTGGGSGPAAGDGATGGAHPGSERDLGQVRDAIEGVRALLDVLEGSMPQELRPLRDALSQLQIAYAREAPTGTGAGAPGGTPSGQAKQGDEQGGEEETPGPGPAQSSGRLWVPGS